ncbi:MAG TPA: YihY/virulence factor BrkB family protein [Chloroflexota bacterium]|nr:YihY/virulence factor BrkB family protein [Chloroflexota bacterium]
MPPPVALRRRLVRGLRPALALAADLPPVDFAIQVARASCADDIPGLAAEMAYQFLFALFPFFIFMAALVGVIGAMVGRDNLFALVMQNVELLAPPAVQQVVREWLYSGVYIHSPKLLTLGAVFSLFGSSVGVATLVKGLNRAHRVEADRPFWLGQILSIAITAVVATVMLLGLSVYTAGEWVGQRMPGRLSLDERFLTTWSILHGPGLAGGLFVVLLALYVILPNVRLPLWRCVPGAAFAMAAWIVVTNGFTFYLVHFTQFDLTYGTVGVAIVLLVWMYAVSTILLVGGEINAVVAGHRNRTASPSSIPVHR